MYLHWACSGFKPESPISFRTWTWKAGSKTPGNLITILDEFAKLRSASIYFIMSAFPIATTPISLGGLSWNLMFEYFWEICGVKSSYFEIKQACRVFYRRCKWIYHNASSVLLKIRNISSISLNPEILSILFSIISKTWNTVKDTAEGDKPQVKI